MRLLHWRHRQLAEQIERVGAIVLCKGITRAGNPCKLGPGPDGYCPLHRPKDQP